MPYVHTGSPCMSPKLSSSGGGSHFWVFPFSHILHQDLPPFILECLANFGFWPLIVYIQIVVCYVFALCGIWLFPLLRVSFRLLCIFLLQPGCWVSPHQPSHLGFGQTMMSTTDASCYCHCNNCSSGRELQCQLTIMISLPQLICVGQSLAFTQCDDFVSVGGQLVASLDKRSLACSNSPSMLCGHWNNAFHQINGCDKLENYTHSLRS